MARLETFIVDSLPEVLQQSGEGFVLLENQDGQLLFDWIETQEQSRSERAIRLTGRALLSAANVTLKASRTHGDALATFTYAE